TKRFTTLDPSATWEPSDFTIQLAKVGAGMFQAGGPPQPSWLTNPGGASGSPTVTWSTMTNDLGLNPNDVSCPSARLCVFAGTLEPSRPGVEIPAVAISTGPFTPHGDLVGTTTSFPQNSDYGGLAYVACASPTMCVLSTIDGIYAASDPTSAHWTMEAPHGGGQVSCPTVSFCAVAAGSGVYVSGAPLGGPSAWAYTQLGTPGLGAIACPTAKLCVAGGSDGLTVGGWIETSTDPLAASSWHGGKTTWPPYAQHSGQYSVGGISCPTTAFCIAAVAAGAPLVSTNPAGGIRTWTQVANNTNGEDNPGFAQCASSGHCTVSGIGSFEAGSGGAGPGIAGYPLPGVSCVSTAFCVTTTDNELAVGQAAP
ncbi:MAG TPA: hypothetical protein VHD39_02355, partial [Acidimicrobiales bacterium]|nr:hypothetical protein [Acidimicrobiales bacterium]